MIKKRIWVITLFPEFFDIFLKCGVVGQALRGIKNCGNLSFEFQAVDLRNYSIGNYKSVDDTAYGGSPGMVMRADILKNALFDIMKQGNYVDLNQLHVICPAPRGINWTTSEAKKFAHQHFDLKADKDLVFICGRYEGIDERFLENYVQEFYSLGNFILSGGEIAVMAILDSSMRFVEGVLGNNHSLHSESFEDDLLDFPVYTKPRIFDEKEVPEVLLSGNHAQINLYLAQEKNRMTLKWRPDLISKGIK